MESNQPLTSVITPVFNGEAHLAECIESVLAQTYDNWEYIINDNASSDRSLEIAQAYAKADPRIHVYTREGTITAAANHHAAFQRMSPQSQYCKVVHADDWLFPGCLTEMVAVAEAHPSVSMVSAYRLDDTLITLDGLPFPSTVTPGREICRRTLRGELYVFGTPTSLLIRSDLIRNASSVYDESTYPLHWDTAACYELLRDWDLGFVHQVLTYTRRSAAGRTSFSRRINTYVVENLKMLRQYGPGLFNAAEYRQCLDQRLTSYFQFLGRSTFYPQDQEFWDYHRTALAELGYSSPRARIFQAALRAVAEILVDPVKNQWKVHFGGYDPTRS